MRRRSKQILIGIAVIVVALGVTYALALARSKARLRGAYAALKQDGRPTRATDVVPPEVPDAQNAAPLYREAARLLKGQSAPKNKQLREYLAGLASSYVGGRLEPEERAEFDELMAREVVVSALATLEEASRRPACQFDHDYDNGLYRDVRAAKPTHPLMRRHQDEFRPGDLRHLACLWGARAYLEAQAGRASQAWDRVQAQFKFAEALRREPVLAGHFPRFSTVGDLCRLIRRLSETAPPDEGSYQKIETLLQDQTDIAPLVSALDAERLLRGEWLFALPCDQLYEALQRDGLFPSPEGVPEALPRFEFRLATFRPRFIAAHAAYLEMMRRGAQMLEGPYFPRNSQTHQRFSNLAGHSFLTNRLAPMLQLEKEFHCDMVAQVNMTRAGLALLRYRQTHGTFPDSLDALNLEDLLDPFAEAPLHYRAEEAGFVVYSVGEDQQDNGGTPRQRRTTSDPRYKTPPYDLVWRFPHATAPVTAGDT
ncbi:MAG: hypothetical protein JSW27_02480 [Phycisphaerales bacterium]|nr:MAG: hypothetical protein JSW27_02480 [Phycisphaerales bacterium]